MKKKEAIISFYIEVTHCGQPVDEEMQERARVVSFRNRGTKGIWLALVKAVDK